MADEEQAAPVATPAAIAHAEELGVDLSAVEGSGADGKITKADVAAAAAVEPSPEPPTEAAPAEAVVAEVPGWPGVVAETAEEHDARRRAEQAAGEQH